MAALAATADSAAAGWVVAVPVAEGMAVMAREGSAATTEEAWAAVVAAGAAVVEEGAAADSASLRRSCHRRK